MNEIQQLFKNKDKHDIVELENILGKSLLLNHINTDLHPCSYLSRFWSRELQRSLHSYAFPFSTGRFSLKVWWWLETVKHACILVTGIYLRTEIKKGILKM